MMKIEITAEGGKMRQVLDEALATLGYIRLAEQAIHGTAMSGTSLSSHDVYAEAVEQISESEPQQGERIVGSAVELGAPYRGSTQRERGKPAPGRQRRTKEEMAEDAEADARDAAGGQAAADKPLISSAPENRVGPQDTVEMQAQDAADEAAETASTKRELTLDDVRDVVGRYYHAYGMGPATGDIRQIFGCAMVDIPANQEAYAKAIAAVEQAIADNPYGRTTVAGAAAAPQPATTIDNLKAVMGRYIQRFGEKEGYEDLPKILEIDNIKLLPAEPAVYAAKVGAVEAALADNPFGRRVLQ